MAIVRTYILEENFNDNNWPANWYLWGGAYIDSGILHVVGSTQIGGPLDLDPYFVNGLIIEFAIKWITIGSTVFSFWRGEGSKELQTSVTFHVSGSNLFANSNILIDNSYNNTFTYFKLEYINVNSVMVYTRKSPLDLWVQNTTIPSNRYASGSPGNNGPLSVTAGLGDTAEVAYFYIYTEKRVKNAHFKFNRKRRFDRRGNLREEI